MTILDFPKYSAFSLIYESDKSSVYRGFHKEKKISVIIKRLKLTSDNHLEQNKYRQEYQILSQFNQENIIKVYELEQYKNNLLLVLEDFSGESLKERLKNYKFSVKESLFLARQVIEGLKVIHAKNIIHKNINPSNIIFNSQTKQVKIIDFSISTVCLQENFSKTNASVLLKEQLPYISPEQTGRMNCSLDYRTDFYSLGVTLYQLLTHKLPFSENNLLELIYSHIARNPPSPNQINPTIPRKVSEIVMKLMAKNAIDRYQTAWQINQDLTRCFNESEGNRCFLKFDTEEQDISDKFHVSQKLYGRDREIKILLKLFYKTRQGISQYLLISGDSGVGKSALIKEIYKPVTEVKGYFITGKFDQYQINTPYSAIVEALQDLVKHLLTENNAKFNEWQKKITTALGVNGKVITNVIPELELIIGKQAQVPQLNPHENQNRFNLVFLNFIQVFTQREHPFILFVDDLQWADQASLKLIDLLITSDLKYFFLIGTYRDKEINLTERLTLTLEKIKEHKVIEQIHLSLLNLNQLNYLLADTLKSPLEKVKNLAKLILLKTAGNPFFIKEFLHSLYSEKLLYFNYSYCCWDWDLDEITKKNVTNNVVNLLSKKIQKLDPDSINLLKYAACLGNQYKLKDLSIFIGKSEQDTNSILNRLRISGLILPIVETFKTIESINTSNNISDKKILYKFIHDRVQQVAYSLISKENKPILHLKLGRLLKQNTCSTLIDSKVFEIVKQLNLGIEVIDSRSELDELASLNLIAGKKAKSTAAYKSALKYFQLALKLLGKESWDRQYSLTLSIHLEAAEASYSSAEFYFMDILLNKVIQQGKQLQDKVKAYEIQIEAYAARNKLSEALKIGLSVLKQLGIKIPSHPSRVNIWLEFILIKLTKVKYLNKDLMQLPKMSDSNKLAAMKILEVLTSAAYFASPSTYTFIVLKRFNLILKYGNFCGSPVVYGDYGLILCGRFNQINSGYQFCRFALDFLLKLQLKEYEAKTLLRLNWIGHFKESFQKIEPMFFEGYQKGLETGDLVYATTSLFLINCNSYLTGRNLKELKKQIEKHQIIIEQTKQKRVLNYLKVYHQIVFDLLNSKITLPYFLAGKYCEEESVYNDFLLVNDRSGIFILYINKAIICYIFKDYEQAQINLAKARKDLESVNGMPLVPIFYFYDSLTRIALIETKNFYLRQKDFLTIIANQRKMKHWADSAPMNYKHKYDLVAAEVHRIKGNKDKAANLYESAILGAKKYKYVNEEALAYELTANFYFKINKIILAEAHIKEAYYNYKFWGAEAKVNYLQEKHSNLLLNGRIFKCISEKSTNISTTISSKLSYLDNLDLALIFETNKLLSGELDLKKLLEKIIKTVIENSCAQKGCLILPTQAETNKLRIEAFANLGGSEVTTLKSIPLDWVDPKLETTFVPVTIVNYVARKQEAVILDNAVKEQRYAKDPYIKATQLKSVLCIPLLNQATLIGLIYLENNLITGAFTSERVRFIEAIGSQAAISIQNAEAKEKLKTAKLELEEFLEAVPIGVFIADAKANPYYTNSAAKKILGNSTVSTQSVSELTKDCELYDESGNIYKDNHPIAQALKGKNIIGLDVQAEISQNKRIPLEINATPVFNRKGDLVYAIAAFQDISDRKKAKKTLEAKNAELESTKKLLEKTNQQLERQNAQLQEQLEKIESLSFKNALQQALLKDANQNNFEYQLGGTLAPDAPTYVVREADITLYRSLIKSQFCYIFNARQMGKSSMQVKIAAQLKSEGYNCISLDLSEFVNERISTATFYSCLIYHTAKKFKISNFNIKKWNEDLNCLSPLDRLGEFLREIVLHQFHQKIVIFIDEIDAILKVKSVSNSFFPFIRSVYNQRNSTPEYKRLTFCLLGRTTPSDLIEDEENTPFNIGVPISLTGFSQEEIKNSYLKKGIEMKCENLDRVIEEVLKWTGGQPFLTQKVCNFIKTDLEYIPKSKELQIIEQLVREKILNGWKEKDEPKHLRTIQDKFIRNKQNPKLLLETYLKIIEDGFIEDRGSWEHEILFMAGIVRRSEGQLKIYNLIYQTIFDREWVQFSLSKS